MAPSRQNRNLAEARERLRLLIAVAAVFVLLAGLTVLITMILLGRAQASEGIMIFAPFFLAGLLLFAASAFINANVIKALRGYMPGGAAERNG
jgi:hypothetical protein